MSTTASHTVDEARVEQVMGQMAGYMTGLSMCVGIWLGDELGFYRILAAEESMTADDLAERANTHPRLTREWLDAQAAGSIVAYDAGSDRYALSAETAVALADEDSPVFIARAMNVLLAVAIDGQKCVDAFRTDGALSWRDHDEHLFAGTEWLFRTGYRAELPSWIAALDGVEERLEQGGSIADIGCGHGAASVVLATTYPKAYVHGFDFHEASIDTARLRAIESDVAGRVEFTLADARGYPGAYDLICFFDCLHDMGDPVGAAAYAREHLAPGGTILLVEPFALDDRETNIAENPMAAIYYTASSFICTPNSLSQDVGYAIGTQAGAARWREALADAGLSHVRQVAATPFNLILEVRP
ncbi:class I SAM-dependent methyltransferase [Solicola gregarius]|uniref:Class I SAM-dependent methyltransferase n=1 Tax=Solicola gregarius TaxID=2908642 RepID=A0AA46TJE8_9ACTN|nr:class I SAM-dependent methyltransferase [Solicola gregarius]UYM05959.1 class I SAM-dependent methyltransferase [Solicola gregarius]